MKATKTIYLMLVLALAGCTEFQTVHPSIDQPSGSTLAVGDTIEIVTADAEKYQFRITAIEEDALAGKDVRIPFEEVRILSIQRFSASRTSQLLLPFAVTAAGMEILSDTVPPPLP